MSRNRLPLIRLLLPIADLMFVSDGASGPFGCVTPESVVIVMRDQRAGMCSTVKHSSQVVIPTLGHVARPSRSILVGAALLVRFAQGARGAFTCAITALGEF